MLNQTIQLKQQLDKCLAWSLLLVGASGSGKTHIAFYILWKWFPKDYIALYRYPQRALLALPKEIRDRAFSFEEYRELVVIGEKARKEGKKVIVFFDDIALFLLSRSGKNQLNMEVVQNMTIARQNNICFLIAVQNLILLEKGMLESMNQFQLRTKMSYTQSVTEREEYRELQLDINDMLSVLDSTLGIWYCPETDEILSFPGIDWLTDDISMPYRGWLIVDGKLGKV